MYDNIENSIKYVIFFVGQKRSLIDNRMKLKLKESLKYFKGDIFFVLEKDDHKVDLSIFNPKEIIYYKYPKKASSSVLMSYGWSQCMKLINKYEKIKGEKYNIIYKTRPDLLLKNYIPNKLVFSNNILNEKIVYGETLGGYGTKMCDPFYAIKDTFNIITRNACEDFFTGFHDFCLTFSKFMSNEALLGYFLYTKNIKKKVVQCRRVIIRMKDEKTQYGSKSLRDDIENISIDDDVYIN